MAIRRFVLVAASLCGLVACASIAGIGPADPELNTASNNGSSGSIPNPDGGAPIAVNDPLGEAGVTTVDGTIETSSGVAIAPAEVDFAFPCNQSSSAKVNLTNHGKTSQDYTASLDDMTSFAIQDGANGTLPPGGTAQITIQAHGATPGPVTGDLHVNVGGIDTVVDLAGTIQGASLTVSPLVVDFGQVHQNTAPSPITATFTNTGNAAIQITGFSNAPPDFTFETPITVPPGGTTTSPIGFMSGPAGQQIDVTGVVPTSNSLCGAPAPLELKAQRVNVAVTATPAAVDFGTISCQQQPPNTTQTVTISNYANADLSYTATLPSGSHFKIVNNTGSGTVPPGNGVDVAGTAGVQLALNSPGSFFGTVTETLTITGPTLSQALSVSVHLLVQGASLTTTQPNNSVFFIRSGSTTVPLTNVGNAPVCVRYALDGQSSVFSVEADDAFQAGTRDGIDVQYQSDGNGHFNGITIQHAECTSGASAPFCTSPPSISLSTL